MRHVDNLFEVTHMKTDDELPDASPAPSTQVPRCVRAPKQSAVLREPPFRGDGLNLTFKNASWERLRDEIYRGRY